jgi:hypothetical protein
MYLPTLSESCRIVQISFILDRCSCQHQNILNRSSCISVSIFFHRWKISWCKRLLQLTSPQLKTFLMLAKDIKIPLNVIKIVSSLWSYKYTYNSFNHFSSIKVMLYCFGMTTIHSVALISVLTKPNFLHSNPRGNILCYRVSYDMIYGRRRWKENRDNRLSWSISS